MARTRLTSPPGEEPVPVAEPRSRPEDYYPAFDLPEEPRLRTRVERRIIALVVLVVLAVGGYFAVVAAMVGLDEDPALQVGNTGGDPALEVDPALEDDPALELPDT